MSKMLWFMIPMCLLNIGMWLSIGTSVWLWFTLGWLVCASLSIVGIVKTARMIYE